MGEFKTKDDAIDFLASEIYWKLERLDPSDSRVTDIDWASLSEDEKDLYRLVVMRVLSNREALMRALAP